MAFFASIFLPVVIGLVVLTTNRTCSTWQAWRSFLGFASIVSLLVVGFCLANNHLEEAPLGIIFALLPSLGVMVCLRNNVVRDQPWMVFVFGPMGWFIGLTLAFQLAFALGYEH